MRKSLNVLMAVPCLLLATACLTDGSVLKPPSAECPSPVEDGGKGTIIYVEILQLDFQKQVFRGRLVDVRNEKLLLEVSGSLEQLPDFQQQSAKIAPRERTVTVSGPLAEATDIVVKPPVPPGPAGQELIRFANQVASSYDGILAAQAQSQPPPHSPTHQ